MYVRFLGEFETFAFRTQQKWDCSKTVVFLLSSISGKKVLCILPVFDCWCLKMSAPKICLAESSEVAELL